MWLVVAWAAQHEVKVDRREACPPRGFGAARVVGGAVRPRAEQRVALDAQALRLGPLHDARDASLLGELINHAYLLLLKRAAVMLCAMRVAARARARARVCVCVCVCVWQLVRTEQCVALSGEYREELLEAQRLAARKRQQLGPEAQPATAFVALDRLKQAVQVTYPQQSRGRRSEAGTVNACMLELTAAFHPSELNAPPPHLSRACSHHERRSSKSWSNL
eukprot:COSAG03_NODE_2543_length_2659_cov_2.672266_4_plen_221_part_00